MDFTSIILTKQDIQLVCRRTVRIHKPLHIKLGWFNLKCSVGGRIKRRWCISFPDFLWNFIVLREWQPKEFELDGRLKLVPITAEKKDVFAAFKHIPRLSWTQSVILMSIRRGLTKEQLADFVFKNYGGKIPQSATPNPKSPDDADPSSGH